MNSSGANLQTSQPMTVFVNQVQSSPYRERYAAVRDVVLYNHGPGTAWISAMDGLQGSAGRDFGVGLAPGEKLTIRTMQDVYAYGDPDDSVVSLFEGGTGTTRLNWLVI